MIDSIRVWLLDHAKIAESKISEHNGYRLHNDNQELAKQLMQELRMAAFADSAGCQVPSLSDSPAQLQPRDKTYPLTPNHGDIDSCLNACLR
jgi:hypothetical protein